MHQLDTATPSSPPSHTWNPNPNFSHHDHPPRQRSPFTIKAPWAGLHHARNRAPFTHPTLRTPPRKCREQPAVAFLCSIIAGHHSRYRSHHGVSISATKLANLHHRDHHNNITPALRGSTQEQPPHHHLLATMNQSSSNNQNSSENFPWQHLFETAPASPTAVRELATTSPKSINHRKPFMPSPVAKRGRRSKP